MEGLYLGIGDQYIEKTKHDSSEFRLLARGNGTEIIMQTINREKIFYLYPGDVPDALEFFFIIEGSCCGEARDKEHILVSGDYFYIKNLKDATYFKALTDIRLLWISTEPVFHYLSESITELVKIVKQVEDRDKYTFQHSLRVQEYSLKIAKHLKLPKDVLENLYFASIFHDVGKIKIPEEILNKPGRLEKEEFDVLKKHSEDGAELVQKTYYAHIGDIILQHHERLDGSGYPFGLKGDEILLEAQIIGVADTYDAITSDRVYRKGASPSVGINELKQHVGRHFSKLIVDAFESILLEESAVERDLK
ncbi:HD-GYP domain-containing protein [Peribacillus glennii]|uniref:HD-GYP domain-containing protein n=1 Tax=Peribacillus glennii TaxID=2303991 RepID=A0A372L8T1_9BACI|nr:HD-GYP domain-containing protein [Peribacillus glennii]RFU61815.1 HD-GYP domain-containing protein [Peribacillus glennii]